MLNNDLVVLASVWGKLSYNMQDVISKAIAGERNQSAIETVIDTIIELDDSLTELKLVTE